MVGEHNVRNALAALAIGVEMGVPVERLREGLAAFLGVKRRLELVGERAGVAVFDDFAHHPTAVAETLRAVRASSPDRRVWAIFEPRSASSCRRVFQADFAKAFGSADEVVLATVFRSSLPEAERLSESQLVSDLRQAGVFVQGEPADQLHVEVAHAERTAGSFAHYLNASGTSSASGVPCCRRPRNSTVLARSASSETACKAGSSAVARSMMVP